MALWDVLRQCEREGSSDSSITNEEVNDLERFFLDHPGIRHVFFNGKKAARSFELVRLSPDVRMRLSFTVLPSTSPANAAMRYDEKLAAWSAVRDALDRWAHPQRTGRRLGTLLDRRHQLLPVGQQERCRDGDGDDGREAQSNSTWMMSARAIGDLSSATDTPEMTHTDAHDLPERTAAADGPPVQRGPHEERGKMYPPDQPNARQVAVTNTFSTAMAMKERAHGGRVVDEVLDLRVAREQQHGIECSHDAQHETSQHRQRDGPRASPIGPLPQRPVQADEQQAQQAAQQAPAARRRRGRGRANPRTPGSREPPPNT